VPIAQFPEAWAQIKTHTAGEGHGHVGVPVRVDREIRIDRLDDLANQRRFMLANRLGDVATQFTLSWNNLLMIVEPSACKLQQSLPITGP
jgi:hypothetical protein